MPMHLGAYFDHPQVSFTTAKGKRATVDKGMYDVLRLLRRAGVETLYSCEDNNGQAYICATLRSSLPFIGKLLFARALSSRAKRTRRAFLRGEFEIDCVLTRGNTIHYRRRFVFRAGRWSRYVLEICASNRYGLRWVMRWPIREMDAVTALFEELVD